MKTCSRCEITKKEDGFYKVGMICRTCKNIQNVEYQRAHREQLNIYHRQYWKDKGRKNIKPNKWALWTTYGIQYQQLDFK